MIDKINEELQQLIEEGTSKTKPCPCHAKKNKNPKSKPIPIPAADTEPDSSDSETTAPSPSKNPRKTNNWLSFLADFRKENPTISPQKELYKQASVEYRKTK